MILENNTPEEEMDEETSPISFFSEDIAFEHQHTDKITPWIEHTIEKYACNLSFINFIFCSDDYLHQLNVSYLDHDTLTDIITFPYTTPPQIEGDIFISIERVRDNAATYKVNFEEELLRVIIHGVLHLCGFKDKTPTEKEEMDQKENEALGHFRRIQKEENHN
jgi:rRNA maturation RNase YbeY